MIGKLHYLKNLFFIDGVESMKIYISKTSQEIIDNTESAEDEDAIREKYIILLEDSEIHESGSYFIREIGYEIDINTFERIGDVPFFYKSLTGKANVIKISIADDYDAETFTFPLTDTDKVMINGQSIFEANHPLHESFTFTITQNGGSNLTYSNSSITIGKGDAYVGGTYVYELVLTHKGREYTFKNNIEVVLTPTTTDPEE